MEPLRDGGLGDGIGGSGEVKAEPPGTGEGPRQRWRSRTQPCGAMLKPQGGISPREMYLGITDLCASSCLNLPNQMLDILLSYILALCWEAKHCGD